MFALTEEMKTSINKSTTTLCSIWTITTLNGESFGYTDHDNDLYLGDIRCEPVLTEMRKSRAINDDLSATGLDFSGGFIAPNLKEDDLTSRKFYGARVKLFIADWKNVAETATKLSEGFIQTITAHDQGFTAEIITPFTAMQNNTGRTYGALCDACLGDSRCGIDLTSNSYKKAAVIKQVIDDYSLTITMSEAINQPQYFKDGFLIITDNEGQEIARAAILNDIEINNTERKITLKTNFSNNIKSLNELSENQAINLIAGCDKTIKSCSSKFNNVKNFRGFPFVPGNDFTLSYPKPK